MTESARPDPDRLLAQLHEEATRASQGRLKIFLGATPGVGKTFAMLEAARAAAAGGRDVVVGVVETHGRADTAGLLDGLELLPRTVRAHRGLALEEFDLDGALARRPSLLLVDELAHTNAPGARHAKRWQDVRELLAAGIDVHTTLNVQHVESLNDVVAQITGVQVRETVPDLLLDEAAEIELVDVSPEVLLDRLRAGKVYVPAQVERALERFFQRGNLIALRELALRRTAERVDAQMLDWRAREGVDRVWPAGERVLVAVPAGPDASRLVRAGRRLATALRGECVALHVETGAVRRAPERARRYAAEALHLAESLGARSVTLTGVDAAEELLIWARGENITRIVVGRSRRRAAPWRRSPVDRLLTAGGGLDVLVLAGTEEAETGGGAPMPPAAPSRREYGAAAAWIVAAGGIAFAVRGLLSVTDIAMLFLLAVVWVASRVGPAASLLGAILAIGLFDFAFVPPYYTFAVSDVRYVLTFLMMLGVAVAVTRLMGRGREQTDAARARERRTALLLDLAQELAEAPDRDAVATVVAGRLARLYDARVAVLVPEGDALRPLGTPTLDLDEHETAVAYWAWRRGEVAGAGTATLPAARGRWVPLLAGGGAVGALGLATSAPLQSADQPLLEAVAGQAAMALERHRLAGQARRDQIEIASERLRTALLSSLSHDLRTPLAGVEGAATTLLGAPQPAAVTREMLVTIVEESRRMGRLIGNLLEMVRMESGSLQVQADWQSIDEIVGVALLRLESALAAFRVEVTAEPDLPLLRVDGLLIEQVLVNLLENAAKYAPPGGTIEVRMRRDAAAVRVEVLDRGPGIVAEEAERIFEKFHRAPGARGGGVGLGLAIARGIVEAHGGRIGAGDRDGGGFRIAFTLPVPLEPPGPVPEVAA